MLSLTATGYAALLPAEAAALPEACASTKDNTKIVSSLSQSQSSNNATMKYLPKNFVADAVTVASPSVVNIRCSVGGFFGHGEAAGSGFIISEVSI